MYRVVLEHGSLHIVFDYLTNFVLSELSSWKKDCVLQSLKIFTIRPLAEKVYQFPVYPKSF